MLHRFAANVYYLKCIIISKSSFEQYCNAQQNSNAVPLTHSEWRTRYMLMADVYRSEVVFKGDAKTIKIFLDKCFTLIDDKHYLDFEKFIPLNGGKPLDVWDCGALGSVRKPKKYDFL